MPLSKQRYAELLQEEIVTGYPRLLLCLFCGDVQEQTGPARDFCSRRCREAAKRARKRLECQPPAEPVFLRYGLWTAEEISYDWRSGAPVAEPGVSCFDVYLDRRAGVYRLDPRHARGYLRTLLLFMPFI